MKNQFNPTSIRSFIPRQVQIAFVVGLVLGVILGWLFSSIVSAIVRFGLVAVLLVPLMLALFFWWRVRQAPKNEPTMMTWGSFGTPQDMNDLFETRMPDPDEYVIDMDDQKKDSRS